jgi:DNA repair exonuclease SbcCD ATPase subunit
MSSSEAAAELSPKAADEVPPHERLKRLQQDLKAATAERSRLEKLHEERCSLRAKVEALDAETAEAKGEIAALTKKVEAEKRRQESGEGSSASAPSATAVAAAAAAGRSWIDPAKTEPMDAEAQSRATEALRQRRARLKRLLAQLRDPDVIVREEDSLRELAAELKQLERSYHAHVRELALRGKQVEAGRAVRLGKSFDKPQEMSAEESEEKEQDYVRRLTDMLNTTLASHGKVSAQCEALREQWEGWFAMLSKVGSRLQAKADAGDLSDFSLPDGQSTAAFKALEMCRELEARHGARVEAPRTQGALEGKARLPVSPH